MKYLPLTNGSFALVDDADFDLVNIFKWRATPPKWTCYARGRVNGKNTSLHSFLLNCPKHLVVDHINGNGLDNRRSNLRIATQSENMRNQKPHADAASKFKGVWKVKDCNRWAVRLWDGKKRHYVGLFKDEEEAARTYDFIAIQVFGPFARLNFPEQRAA